MNLRKREPINYRVTRGYIRTNRVSLNDDCWLAVFERLTTDDLANVSHACKRFRALASTIFRLNRNLPTTGNYNMRYPEITAAINLKTLSAFRQEIKRVVIGNWTTSHHIIKVFSKMCHGTLTELVLKECNFLDVAISESFENLKRLTIFGLGFDVDTVRLNTLFRNVEHLVLYKVFICRMEKYCSCFPNLKSFELYRTELNGEEMSAFQRQHPRITITNFKHCIIPPYC